MARVTKRGLSHFPMDVGFLRNEKILLIQAELGARSVAVILAALCWIFEERGYFLPWGSDERLLMAARLGGDCSPEYVDDVINACLSRSIFDESIFQACGALTSADIQRAYLKEKARNTKEPIYINEKYLLLNVDDRKDVPPGTRSRLVVFQGEDGEEPEIKPPFNKIKPQLNSIKPPVNVSSTYVLSNKTTVLSDKTTVKSEVDTQAPNTAETIDRALDIAKSKEEAESIDYIYSIDYINSLENTNVFSCPNSSENESGPGSQRKGHQVEEVREPEPKRVFEHESKPYRCAAYLARRIRERLPGRKEFTETRLQSWALDFDRLNRLDGQSWRDIAAVLDFSQTDPFWRTNILSGGSFRKGFDRLYLQMMKEVGEDGE